MTSGANGAAFTKHAAKRQNCERVKRWQRAQQARGRCRVCGLRREPESPSRCLACLERSRRYERRRRGITTAGRRHRGRPPLGDLGVRRRAFEQDEAWQERRSDRWAGVPTPSVPRWEQQRRLRALKRQDAEERRERLRMLQRSNATK